jgi:hypothetical protein
MDQVFREIQQQMKKRAQMKQKQANELFVKECDQISAAMDEFEAEHKIRRAKYSEDANRKMSSVESKTHEMLGFLQASGDEGAKLATELKRQLDDHRRTMSQGWSAVDKDVSPRLHKYYHQIQIVVQILPLPLLVLNNPIIDSSIPPTLLVIRSSSDY